MRRLFPGRSGPPFIRRSPMALWALVLFPFGMGIGKGGTAQEPARPMPFPAVLAEGTPQPSPEEPSQPQEIQGDSWTPEQRQRALESFEQVWTTVRDKHWDPDLGGLDWRAIHEEFRPRIEDAKTPEQVRGLLQEMVDRLGQTHFSIIPAELYAEVAPQTGPKSGEGTCGLEIRVLDGKALVTAVEESVASEVHPGWEILTINGERLAPLLTRVGELYPGSTLRPLALMEAVQRRLEGDVGDTIRVQFRDGEDRIVEQELPLIRPPGNPYRLGNMPPFYVRFKSRKLEGDVGYIAFNSFLDPVHLMPAFEKAVKSFLDCAGILIDLRGNGGGIGAMGMGLAGWFIEGKDQWLGTIYTRETQLKMIVNPRLKVYKGPVAVLVDGTSASCSELFSGGLQDLGRARIFGTRTAGAALPSTIEKLPNGDGFQYAFADFVSRGGQRLEGNGVTPDEEVKLTRQALLQGNDPVIEAAIRWIRSRSAETPPQAQK